MTISVTPKVLHAVIQAVMGGSTTTCGSSVRQQSYGLPIDEDEERSREVGSQVHLRDVFKQR